MCQITILHHSVTTRLCMDEARDGKEGPKFAKTALYFLRIYAFKPPPKIFYFFTLGLLQYIFSGSVLEAGSKPDLFYVHTI